MALVFAVFLVALLVVFLRHEGRARRVARLRAALDRAAAIVRAALARGSETSDRIAAYLAQDHRSAGGAGTLLSPADDGSADPVEQNAQS
jgi:hypothetical protein